MVVLLEPPRAREERSLLLPNGRRGPYLLLLAEAQIYRYLPSKQGHHNDISASSPRRRLFRSFCYGVRSLHEQGRVIRDGGVAVFVHETVPERRGFSTPETVEKNKNNNNRGHFVLHGLLVRCLEHIMAMCVWDFSSPVLLLAALLCFFSK